MFPETNPTSKLLWNPNWRTLGEQQHSHLKKKNIKFPCFFFLKSLPLWLQINFTYSTQALPLLHRSALSREASSKQIQTNVPRVIKTSTAASLCSRPGHDDDMEFQGSQQFVIIFCSNHCSQLSTNFWKLKGSQTLPVATSSTAQTVAEVSKIGNLWERSVAAMHGRQNETTDGPKSGWGPESLSLPLSPALSRSLPLSPALSPLSLSILSISLSISLSPYLSVPLPLYFSISLVFPDFSTVPRADLLSSASLLSDSFSSPDSSNHDSSHHCCSICPHVGSLTSKLPSDRLSVTSSTAQGGGGSFKDRTL